MLRNLIIANPEDEISSTKIVSRALRLMRLTLHTGLKVSPFELHHVRSLIAVFTNLLNDYKSYLSNWKSMNVSVPPKLIAIYVARNEKTEVTDHIIMARKRQIPYCSSQKSLKRKPVRAISGNFQYPETFSWN